MCFVPISYLLPAISINNNHSLLHFIINKRTCQYQETSKLSTDLNKVKDHGRMPVAFILQANACLENQVAPVPFPPDDVVDLQRNSQQRIR